MHPRLRLTMILGVALAVAATAATAALGTTVKRFDSKVTLSSNNPFHGRVISKKHACEVQRKVKVFNKKPGPDGLFGKTTTDGQGKWSIPAMPNGKFYAKVTRRKEGAAGTIFVCRPDLSPVKEFGG
jgi:hypothetical protein